MTPLERRIRKKLAGLDESGLLRRLQPPSGLDLSSNDYLALAEHPRIKRAMAEAVERMGCGSTASRLLRGDRDVWANVEGRFARFKGTEAALYFSTGYAANLGVLSALLEPEDVVFSDELNHASLIDGMRLGRARRAIFPHRDVDELGRLMREAAADRGAGQLYLVTESLFSMDGDIAPLKRYAELCREHGAALIVDEAHAVGVFGESGAGLIEQLGVASDVLLSVNTAGKAFGAAGAFVAGPQWIVDCLVQAARTFVFSTAPPPAIAAAIDAALDAASDEPERRRRLLDCAAAFRAHLRESGLDIGDSESQIVPVLVGDNERAVELACRLQAEGYDVRAIRPPTVPAGTARLRVSLNLNVTENQVDEFADLLIAECKNLLPSAAACS